MEGSLVIIHMPEDRSIGILIKERFRIVSHMLDLEKLNCEQSGRKAFMQQLDDIVKKNRNRATPPKLI